ncbi:MAG: DNA polymerase III subunit epsilon [Pseudomonadota bacterium]|nr:DNA polymerase III subunit epsilon [Pseudomonadota bacterium]
MREVVLDTETTGLNPKGGDRIVEIGCVELINHLETGNYFHEYINPERDMPEKAQAVHGLSEKFLSDKPIFSDISKSFTEFIGTSPLIIHNAEFDVGFINWELQRIHFQPLKMERVIDTLLLARKQFPGSPANLDALCRRFQINNSDRDLHGALIDAKLLAEVYLELIGGRQQQMNLHTKKSNEKIEVEKIKFKARPHLPSLEEKKLHAQFLKKIKSPIWYS